MLRIGLTGGVGSGKTTVSDKFHTLFNTPVIDADIINRQLLQKDSLAYSQIIDTFGTTVISSSGDIDRKYLRERIFSEPSARTQLEAILHPKIRSEISKQISELNSPYALVVIPLLFELKMQDQFDRILVVDADFGTQIERVRLRDQCTAQDVTRIIDSQIDSQSRNQLADDIIVNNADLNRLDQQIKALHKKYIALNN